MMSVKTALDTFCPPALENLKTRIKASPQGYRLARGAFWSFAGAAISRGLGLLASILVARVIGRDDFGRLGMVQSTVGIFGSLAGFGMGLTAVKHVAEFRSTDPDRAGRVIALSSVFSWLTGGTMTLVLIVLAPWLATHTLASPEMSGLLRAGSLLLLLGGVNGAQTGVLSGFEAFRTVAVVNTITGLLSFPLALLGALKWGLDGAVWALVGNLTVNCVLNFIAVRAEARRASVTLGYRDCTRELPLLWKYSLPAVLGGCLAGPLVWFAGALLVNHPNGYSQMGLYNAVARVKMVADQALNILLAPLLPVLSETLGKRDTAGYRRAASTAFSFSLLIAVPFAVIQIAAPFLTTLPFGKAYAGQHAVAQWLMIDLAITGLFVPLGCIINSMSRMWFSVAYQLCWGLLYCGSAALLIPRYGAAGLAAAQALSHIITTVACLFYLSARDRALLCDLPLMKLTAGVLLIASVCLIAGRFDSPWIGLVTGFAALWPIWLIRNQLAKVSGPSAIL